MASKLEELTGRLQAKSAEIHAILEEAGPDLDMDNVKSLTGDSTAKVAELRRLKAEEDAIGTEVEQLRELNGMKSTSAERMQRQSVGVKVGLEEPTDEAGAPRWAGLKAVLNDSEGLKAIREGAPANGKKLFEIEDAETTEAFLNGYGQKSAGLKTTITLGDITPLADRRPDIVPSAQFRLMVSDLLAAGTTTGNTLTYIEETTFTSAAAEIAENTAKGESTLDFTERTDTVRKIATWIPATDEVLADNAQLESYIRNRLVFMVRQREEGQLISGNGTPPNIQGIVNRSGIQTQAKGAVPTPDAFFLAMQKVRVTGDAEPDGHVIHPDDWSEIRLLRTADGIYIWGSPQEAGPERLWGLPVRQTTAIANGTGLTGAFGTFAQLYRRAGLTVTASTEHASYFIENRIALLAETRLGLAVYRPAAFCTVTGI